MGLYLMLSNLTEKGRSRVKSHPERINEVNTEVEAKGFKIIAQYALLGEYDFATILDVPDNWNMTRLSMDLSARGTLETHTFPALRADEFVRFMKAEHDEDDWARKHKFGDLAPSDRDLGENLRTV
ncbi:MAG: GYD domain-containing protein [Chloroflexi bacterium]|nr:GYD domain-containing protein [Chloroflexota bacterium]